MPDQFISQLQESSDYQEAEVVIAEFAQLSPEEKKAVEPKLIKLFTNGRVDEFVRSRAAEMLAVLGTEASRNTLMERLKTEKSGLSRGRIALALARSFTGDERVDAIINQLKLEKSVITRRMMTRALIESNSPQAADTLLDLIDEPDAYIRNLVIQEMGNRQIQAAVPRLIERLETEDPDFVTRSILRALAEIKDPKATTAFIRYLQSEDLPLNVYITLIEGLGALPVNDTITEALLQAVCHPEGPVSITATNVLVKFYKRKDAAYRIASYGVQQSQPQDLVRIADALRVIGDKSAIAYLQSLQNDASTGKQAQTLLELIGGQQAIDALMDHRLEVLQKAGRRVEKFDEEALTIFHDTIDQAKRGFHLIMLMSGGIFVLGAVFLLASIVQSFTAENWEKIVGLVQGSAGLATLLALFYIGPVERIQKGVAQLVQTEIAFLGYIRQVTQISAMFEREYLKADGFNMTELKKLLSFTEKSVKETMPLVNQYTAVTLPSLDEDEEN